MKTIVKLAASLGVLMGILGFSSEVNAAAPAPGTQSGKKTTVIVHQNNKPAPRPGMTSTPKYWNGRTWVKTWTNPHNIFEMCICGQLHNHPIDVVCRCVHGVHKQPYRGRH